MRRGYADRRGASKEGEGWSAVDTWLSCHRENDVFVVTVPGEPKSVVRPGGFSVKALLRSHDLGHSAPMSIDLSPWGLARVPISVPAFSSGIGEADDGIWGYKQALMRICTAQCVRDRGSVLIGAVALKEWL
ncbi:hypothetical protein EMWEY_00030120 [Eimeria maxima]|uniref:Uncharacterized protein n=1 Tax=Eimeria maxima TaxID=5804 RepID=U6MFG6_EIMMA|nr:hypothetical protein EMWEY_00030120 [Eimeria maxima]CDJ60400.1 hypothetical protein EMWEY_00030120 [Eimeria maxima]